MKISIITLFIAFFCLAYSPVAAQEFATIRKNHNVQAKQLHHDLNSTKDTLLLQSDRKINYVYSINRQFKKEIYSFINDTSCKVPLNQLSKGKHTIVVGQSPLKIVFVIHVYGDDKTPVTSELMEVSSSH